MAIFGRSLRFPNLPLSIFKFHSFVGRLKPSKFSSILPAWRNRAMRTFNFCQEQTLKWYQFLSISLFFLFYRLWLFFSFLLLHFMCFSQYGCYSVPFLSLHYQMSDFVGSNFLISFFIYLFLNIATNPYIKNQILFSFWASSVFCCFFLVTLSRINFF